MAPQSKFSTISINCFDLLGVQFSIHSTLHIVETGYTSHSTPNGDQPLTYALSLADVISCISYYFQGFGEIIQELVRIWKLCVIHRKDNLDSIRVALPVYSQRLHIFNGKKQSSTTSTCYILLRIAT